MSWLENKTAIITGSTRGIGLALAKVIIQEGGNVTVFCRHGEHGKAAFDELGGDESRILISQGDVGKSADASRIIKETIKKFGTLDILVNNAGTLVWKNIEEITDEEYREIISTNLDGTFYFTREAVRFLKGRKDGRIVNISSGLGLRSEAKYSAYSATKFAMIGLAEAVADELKNDKIMVNSIALGGVATRLHLEAHPWEDPAGLLQPDEVAKRIAEIAFKDKPAKSGETYEIYK